MANQANLRACAIRGVSVAAMALALGMAQPALTQTTSTLRGHVEGAKPGTAVVATDADTGQRVTAATNSSGDYTIPGLRPSAYHVEAAGNPAQDVTVPVGQTVTVDFGQRKTEGGEIVVTGKRTQEVRTAEVATNVSQEQIKNLPQNDRNFLNFAALAPGVTVTPSSGARQVRAGAISADNINVFIDGLSLKNPVNHGGVAGQNFSRGNPFPQLAVQEFKVDTQNFKAEYEQAGSAIITAVTKTGGQEFHGDAFGEWQPKAFIGRPYFDRPGNANNPNGDVPKPDYNRWQYGADIGGPIIKDKLHFFFAFEGTDQKLPSASVTLPVGLNGVPQDIADILNKSYAESFNQKLYFGKLTFFASEADTVNASAFLRREQNLSDFGGNSAPSHGHNLLSNVDVYQLEWNHRGDNWLNEATLAYSKVSNGTPRVSDGPEIILTNGPTIGSNLAFLGANPFEQDDHQKSWTVKDNVTFFGGAHVVKAGLKLTFNKYQRLEDSQSNGTYFFDAATYTGFDTSTPFAAQVSTVPVQPATAKNDQVGVFIQDDWSPNEHWTVNAGLRWDYESNSKNEDFVTPDNIAAALRSYPGWQAAGINPEDYISNGHNRHPYLKAFQPRLGVSYDVKGDRDLVFFAGAGRYYDRPLFITAGIETIKSYYQSVSTVFPTADMPLPKDVDALRALAIAQGTGGQVWVLNNDTKLPFTDQFNIGVRKRFGQIHVALTLAHNRSHNIFQYVRGNRYSNGWYTRVLEHNDPNDPLAVTGCHDGGNQWIQDNFPTTDYATCAAKQGNLAGFVGKLNIGENGGKATYDAIYLTADKPFVRNSRWGFTASLTIQRARTNDAQELGSDEFYNGPAQDVYGNEYVNGTEKFRFVGTGIVRGPWDTVLSATLTLAGSPAFGNVIFYPNAPDGACCYGNMGGALFAHKDIAYKNLDMRIAKTFTLPWGHDVELSFAAFNLFDWVNRSYSAWGAGSGVNPTLQENGTVGNARSFQAGVKYSF